MCHIKRTDTPASAQSPACAQHRLPVAVPIQPSIRSLSGRPALSLAPLSYQTTMSTALASRTVSCDAFALPLTPPAASTNRHGSAIFERTPSLVTAQSLPAAGQLLGEALVATLSNAASLLAEASLACGLQLTPDGNLESGPQGHVLPYTCVRDPCAWTAADWVGREGEYTYQLTPQDIQEIDVAVATFTVRLHPAVSNALSDGLLSLTKEAFPLPTLGPKLAAMAQQHLKGPGGRGFQLLRGLPTHRLSRQQALLAYMGIAAHLGYAFGPQRKDGKLVHHIKAVNSLKEGEKAYIHGGVHPAHPLGYHCDGQADVVSLLCLQQAPVGGESRFASGAAIHNEMLRGGRKDLVQLLAAPGLWCRNKGRYQDVPAGEEPWWSMPVLDYTAGKLAVHYAPHQYSECFERYGHLGLGSMSPQQQEAMQLFEAIGESAEFTLRLMMQPGDMQFVNNALVLHARSGFVDGEAPHQKRHLVRLWLLDQELEQHKEQLPPHLAFPRDYSPASGYSAAACPPGLMRPQPHTFFVPIDAEDPRN